MKKREDIDFLQIVKGSQRMEIFAFADPSDFKLADAKMYLRRFLSPFSYKELTEFANNWNNLMLIEPKRNMFSFDGICLFLIGFDAWLLSIIFQLTSITAWLLCDHRI